MSNNQRRRSSSGSVKSYTSKYTSSNHTPQRSRSPSADSHYSQDAFSENSHKRGRSSGPRGSRAHKSGKQASSSVGGKTSTMSGGVDTVTRRVLSARRLKINELRNENEALKRQMAAVMEENKTMKRCMQTQGRTLDKFEGQGAEIDSVLARHAEEVRVARESERRMKERAQKLDKKLKEKEEDLHRKDKLLAKLKSLVEDKSLPERDDLSQKLTRVTDDLAAATEKIKKLEQHVELLNKNHKHELGIERARLREANSQLAKQQSGMQELQKLVKDRERELGTRNIYSNQSLKPTPPQQEKVQQQQQVPSTGTPPSSQRQISVPAMPVNAGILLRDNSKTSDLTVGLSPRQKAQKYNELLRTRNEQFGVMEEDHLQQDRARRQAEEEETQLELEEKKLREARELEEERRRQEHERSERERQEREAQEKLERERRERELYEREVERRAQEEHERQQQQRIEAERLQASAATAAAVGSKEKDELLQQLVLIDKKQGKDTDVDEFDARRRTSRDYQFTQSTQNLHRGRPVHDSPAAANGKDGHDGGAYMPSFGPGRFDSKAKTTTTNATDKARKNSLLEDLFGKQTRTNISNSNNNNNNNNNAGNASNWRAPTAASGAAAADMRREGSNVSDGDDGGATSSSQLLPRRVRQSATTILRPAVNAIDKASDDDIEELTL